MQMLDWANLAPNDTATQKVIVSQDGTAPTWAALSALNLIDLSAMTNGQLIIGKTGLDPVLAALTGTANQLVVTNGAGTITLSLPQSIHTGGTPQFARMGLGAAADAAHILLLSGGTITTDAHLVDGAVTWNAGGVTFTASKINVTDTASAAASLLQDLQVGGASKWKVTKAGDVTAAGIVTPTGGVAAAGGFSTTARLCHTGGAPAQVSTDGTELDVVVTELYVAEVFIPANCIVTGGSVLWGTNTNGNAKICLFDSAGTRVAISASTDVSGFTGDSYGTRIAFSAPYSAKGPATYYLGVICDDNTNDINTHTLGNFGAGKITGLVYATEAGYATISAPSTFTTGLGPIATLY